MQMLAALFAAAALVVGSPGHGYANVELIGPPGAELHIDGRPVTVFDNSGRVALKLSAVRHRLSVVRDGRLIETREVTFGAGGRVVLRME
jgi:hypothetical protein